MEQIYLFDDKNTKTTEGVAGDRLKFYRSELQEISYMSVEEAFQGFNEIRAITFSYDVTFINKIMTFFEYGEIVLGGRYMTRTDPGMQDLLAHVLTDSEIAADVVRKHDRLVKMMVNKNLYIRSPKIAIDHRKLYLLRADDGRTRVIKGSANMSGRAWGGDQLESYDYDDSQLAYEAFISDFETAWIHAEEIPEDVVAGKKTGNPEKDIPLIKKVVETQKAVVVQEPAEETRVVEDIRYTIDHAALLSKNKELLVGVKPSAKKGIVEIIPSMIKKVRHNFNKSRTKKLQYERRTEEWPSLDIDLYEEKAFLNDKEMDLNPSEEAVKSDIALVLEAFENFNEFLGDTDRLKEAHFKFMSLLFSSPFHAKLRCTAFLRNIQADSVPLFLLVASSGPNTGKTFMGELALKLMTGKDLRALSKEHNRLAAIRAIINLKKGTPVFIDEIDNTYFANIRSIIKDVDDCEKSQREHQPMILFASNDVTDPGEMYRKRMVFLRYNSNIRSEGLDQVAYKGKGKSLKRRATNALYRAYLRRMIPAVREMIDYMIHAEDIPSTYYPDIVATSSGVFRSILRDYGYAIPKYMPAHTWHNDFSVHAKHISSDAINEIRELWNHDPKTFEVKRQIVTIKMGSDSDSRRTAESWRNSLPAEFNVRFTSNRDGSFVSLDRAKLEERLGFTLGGLWSFFRR